MKVTETERKEGTKPCCGKGYPKKIRAERERILEVPTDGGITENNSNADRSEYGMLEES